MTPLDPFCALTRFGHRRHRALLILRTGNRLRLAAVVGRVGIEAVTRVDAPCCFCGDLIRETRLTIADDRW